MPTSSHASPITEGAESSGSAKPNKVPRWVPITLLGLSTAALIVPIVLLRRHKANVLTRSLQEAPPPPRRTTTAVSPGIRSGGTTPPRLQSPGTATSVSSSTTSSLSAEEAVDDFNYALYTAKAFGYATAMVMTGALATVWGVKSYMGVQTTEEFASRMRSLILTHMPGLMARLHRAPADEDHAAATLHSPNIPESHILIQEATQETEWNWPDAEQRLRSAFDHGGFSGWAEAVLQELEAEGKLERRKRGHS